jgi:hypothetical protein
MDQAQHAVFISHAQREQKLADELADCLRHRGAIPWLATREHVPGESVASGIRKALDKADTFVLLIGPQQTDWTHFEWSEILKRAWRDRGTVIVPVIVDHAEPPGYLRDRLTVKMDSGADHDWDQVVAYLQDPRERGVARTAEGEARLKRRLVDLREEALTIAAREPSFGAG